MGDFCFQVFSKLPVPLYMHYTPGCVPIPLTLARRHSDLSLVVHQPASFHLASSAVTPAGSVHKSINLELAFPQSYLLYYIFQTQLSSESVSNPHYSSLTHYGLCYSKWLLLYSLFNNPHLLSLLPGSRKLLLLSTHSHDPC